MFNKDKKAIVKIEGMMCEHCAKKVVDTISSIDNVSKVKVNLKEKEAIVSYKESLDTDLIIKKVSELDYKVTEIVE